MARFYTVGHSSRSAEEFVETVRAHGVTLVVDVRRFPGSERNPQFDAEALAETLGEHGIEYRHIEALGGRRSSPLSASPNAAWENASFRAYADYALTADFQDALEELIALAAERTPAITCAEAVYWRCHRRIVADWLVARGHDVVHVFGPDRADEHELTRFAEIRDGRVLYPEDEGTA
ncbi:DUF488 domain-containing protein [Halomarina pelagica]|uniref:DUF488 domain-containing protein n=1 Tax=Halomarina pelagica TaxID=2961599 RepID=UPI0020C1F978|nr:DUF488 domain-containing protein [Halomarina sp. BND7]